MKNLLNAENKKAEIRVGSGGPKISIERNDRMSEKVFYLPPRGGFNI